MTRRLTAHSLLYALSTAIMLFQAYTLVIHRDIWTDTLFDISDQTLFAARVLFWYAVGICLFVITYNRSKVAALVCGIALAYSFVAFFLNVFPLAKFYLTNTSGLSGLKILASVAAPGIAQIILFGIAIVIAQTLSPSQDAP